MAMEKPYSRYFGLNVDMQILVINIIGTTGDQMGNAETNSGEGTNLDKGDIYVAKSTVIWIEFN